MTPVKKKGDFLHTVNVRKIAEEIKRHASQSRTEEELKIRVENTLRPILDKMGIEWAKYERAHGLSVSEVRPDALYSTVIIEYKAPGKFESPVEFEKAKEQVKKYITKMAKSQEYYGKYFGVVLDGYKIGFVRFRKGEWEESKCLEVNAQTILKLLEAIRGLRRKPIDAEELLLDFGPKSEIARKSILTLYETLIKAKSPRTSMLFEDWKRVFSQVCAYSPEKLSGLIKYYGLDDQKKMDVEKLMFAVHTYYTLLMKLITSEIITLFADSFLGSYLKKLEDAYYIGHEELKDELARLEEGGIFAEIGIKNFLEADYFAWYLDEWNKNIANVIFEIVNKLLDYEPATVELTPERVKDLFKRLYQNLVPRDVRHKLGEYYTPDWLAELVLDEVGYDGNPDKRILDPACGSGTFLVLAIKRIREYAEEHFIDQRTLITKIVENVRGIDLNPLAVLAAKANYIIALSDLLRYRPREGIEIPIYLADSIGVKSKVALTGAREYEIETIVGKFWVREEIVRKGLWEKVLSFIDYAIKLEMDETVFEKSLSKEIASKDALMAVVRLYKQFLKLEREGKDRIWTKVLKNSIAPMLIGKFDYVVGNPPWINWETLPESYRSRPDVLALWDQYGLLEKTKGIGLGKVKRDISMLFVARCFNLYTKENGKLAFLVPFTLFKTQAGAGFRKWLANKVKVVKIHDLVTLYPFEGATNRTSLLIIKRGKTKFPIPCIMWHNPRSKGMDMEASLEDVKNQTKRFDMILAPIEKNKVESSWMIVSKKAYSVLQKIMRQSEYKAHAGVFTGVNGIYWVRIIRNIDFEKVQIENLPEMGKDREIKKIQTVIEKDLLYPLVRGQNQRKWYVKYDEYILLPVDKEGQTLSHSSLKISYPKTYQYFSMFKNFLIKRKAEPYKSKLRLYREKPFSTAEKSSPPFYWLFNVSPSLKPYKIIWKEIAGKISGKGTFSVSVIGPVQDETLGKKVLIPDHKLMFIPLDNEDEAYYIAGVLNSSFSKIIVAGYTIETAMDTHILEHIYIPKFNPKNKLHLKLSELSKKAHELAKRYHEQNDEKAWEELKKVEEEIDKTVAKLYGISGEELEEIKRCLGILKEGSELD